MFQQTFSLISIWSIIIPFCVGLVWFKKLSGDSILIWGMVFFGTIPQLMSFYLPVNDSIKNIAYNIYTPCECFFVGMLFYTKFCSRPKLLVFKVTWLLYGVITVFVFIKMGLLHFINELAGLNNFVYTLWIMLLFLEQYELDNPFQLNAQNPFFWFLIALLFYTTCTTTIFLFWNDLEDAAMASLKIFIHSIFNINMYVMFTIGMIKDAKLAKVRQQKVSL